MEMITHEQNQQGILSENAKKHKDRIHEALLEIHENLTLEYAKRDSHDFEQDQPRARELPKSGIYESNYRCLDCKKQYSSTELDGSKECPRCRNPLSPVFLLTW